MFKSLQERLSAFIKIAGNLKTNCTCKQGHTVTDMYILWNWV